MEDRQKKNLSNANWIWGGLLIGLGALFLLQEVIPGLGRLIWGIVWAAGFVMASLAMYVYYSRNREHWWVLIPAYVCLVVGGIIIVATLRIPGTWIASFILYSVGLPFLIVYMRNRQHWWALIPAYTMAAVGSFPPLTRILGGFGIAAYWQFAIALPFLVVYIRNRKNWWALIPGGIFTVLGVIFATMGSLWLIPVAMILTGLYVLVRQLGTGRKEPVAQPTHGPAADRPLEGFEPLGIVEEKQVEYDV